MRRILDLEPGARILALTSFAGDNRVVDAIQAGATGYLLKDVLKPDLLRALRDVAMGRAALHPEAQRQLMLQVAGNPTNPNPPSHEALTKREEEVLRLIARGNSNKEIASALSLTEGTVKGYVSVIFDKLGVADRTQAALYAVKHGLE
jgi:DNA-binding NarL/FixJ family response regulator